MNLARSSRIETGVIGLAALALCASIGIWAGQDTNWDLQNYHYYSIYALVHGRLNIDIAPSQLQTWFNPAASLLQYGVINTLRPQLGVGVLAAISAPSIVLVYILTANSLRPEWRRHAPTRIFFAALASIGAFSSPMFLSELGTTLADVLVGTFVLAALAALFTLEFSSRGYFAGALLLGVAIGLKLTNGFYFIGWLAALLVTERRNLVRPVFLSGLGAILTYIPLGGFWSVYLAIKTGNPFFPIYNNIFKSALYPPVPLFDERFSAKKATDVLRYLAEWPAGLHPTGELPFVDIRLTVLVLVLLVVLLSGRFVFSNAQTAPDDQASTALFTPRKITFLVVFFAVSFIVWIFQFGIQRYVVAIEQLAPLLIIMLLSLLAGSRRALAVGSLIVVTAITVVSQRPDYGRAPYTADWFGVNLPPPLTEGDTLFVMLSDAPTSYIIPFLPASDVFVRIESNLPITPEMGLGQQISARIAAHRGVLRTLAPADYPLARSDKSLAAYGLRADPDSCADIGTKMGVLRSCGLRRVGS